jgi:thiol-disulfide isomerase/thioredoxin
MTTGSGKDTVTRLRQSRPKAAKNRFGRGVIITKRGEIPFFIGGKMKAPEINGDIWFNSHQLTEDDLKGKVVLVDFWTYTCANCLRTLPYLRDWWDKYRTEDFLIIGVHTPEFEFEKETENVRQAVESLQITWPVVLDNDHTNWNNFANRYWPAKYLIDKSGNIVYSHFGEGAYAETEIMIQNLIKDNLGPREMPNIREDEHTHGPVCFVPTPELYCGYFRGILANPEDFVENEEHEYKVTPADLPHDVIALDGKFLAAEEYLESREKGASILLEFKGTEVNLVLHPVGDEATVILSFDQQELTPEIQGTDVNDCGEVVVNTPRMYNLIKSRRVLHGILSIRAEAGNFRAFAFTFSGCES